jgi:hypothetical protein
MICRHYTLKYASQKKNIVFEAQRAVLMLIMEIIAAYFETLRKATNTRHGPSNSL